MQNFNSVNSFLYQTDDNSSMHIQGHGYQLKLELYDTMDKITQISAYTFHPNKTTLWNSIVNWVTEFFYGRTAVLVRVEGEDSALYVRVDDLSRILNISPKSILMASKGEDATDFIVSCQIERTVEKIKKLVQKQGIIWTAKEQEDIKELIQEVGYRHVFKVVDSDQFNSQSMAVTLMQIGKQLAQRKLGAVTYPGAYEFSVSLPDIFIWKVEDFKKTKVNLFNLDITEEDFLAQTLEKVKTLAKKEGVQWSYINQIGIELLIRKFGYQNVLDAVNSSPFQPGQMACTLVEIGRELANYSCSDPEHKQSYQFMIHLPHVDIWRKEYGKKIKMDLKDLTIIVEDLPKPAMISFPSQLTSGSKSKSPSILNKITKVFKPDPNKEKEEFGIITQCLSVHPKDLKHLAALADRVGYPNLITALGCLEKDDKNIMINTFIQIGKELSAPAFLDGIFSKFRLKYKHEKMEKTKQLTYAFAINKKDVFIVQGSNPKCV